MNKLNEIYEKKDLKYIIKEYITNKNFLDNCYPYYDSSFDLDYRLLKMQNDYLALEYYYRTRDCLNYKFTISKEEYSSIRGITIDCSEETDEEKKKNKNKEYNQTFTAFSILMYNLIKEVKYPESQAYYTALYILNGAGDPRHFFSNIAFYNQIKESIAYEAITNDISFKMIIDGEKKQYKLTNEGLK